MAASKFSGIFENSPVPEPQEPPGRTEKPTAPAKAIGRPPGKRSDPAYKQYSVLLQKKTHRQVSDILRSREEGGPDVSELVQQLLEEWLKKQQKA